MADLEVQLWAQEEFGRVWIGDQRRRGRLVEMAARAAEAPAGRITEVFRVGAERGGAYRLLESKEVSPQEIGRSTWGATARRCRGEELILVPTDGSSLTLLGTGGTKGLGPVSTKGAGAARGMHVLSAMAVRQDGTTMGLCSQHWWARGEERIAGTRRKRRVQEKETGLWIEVLERTVRTFQEAGVQARLWFQLDREGDFREMLKWAEASSHYVTVRAAHNRRVTDAETRYLWETLEAKPALGHYDLFLPGGHGRHERTASMEVRAGTVTLDLLDKRTGVRSSARLGAVLVREVGTHPPGEEGVEWLLLSNHPVESFTQAREVLNGYALRWRIEDFHKTWKVVCGVEEIHLREAQYIIKWAVILAAVAMRIERMKLLARTTPEAPATEELTPVEIDAVILLRKPRGYGRGATPSIALVVRWIADLGGYVGAHSGGPPGSIVIARGLRKVSTATETLLALAASEEM